MKLIKYLANLGYGNRKHVMQLFADGRVTTIDGLRAHPTMAVSPSQLRVDADVLDPPPGMCLMLHKPAGYTCSTCDQGPLVGDLLPPRFNQRRPQLVSVGRLDKESSGLLLFTDDGQLLHRLISPRNHLAKYYEATLADDLRGDEIASFASGHLCLKGEKKPLRPVYLTPLSDRHVRLTLFEGRYHQIRRMFAAMGNKVLTLHRHQYGGLALGSLPPGQWRFMTSQDLESLWTQTQSDTLLHCHSAPML